MRLFCCCGKKNETVVMLSKSNSRDIEGSPDNFDEEICSEYTDSFRFITPDELKRKYLVKEGKKSKPENNIDSKKTMEGMRNKPKF